LLRWISQESTREILLAIQSTVKKLEELRFQECVLPRLKLEQLKRAKFCRCNEDSVYRFLSVNEGVDEDLTDQ
jgi:hypothetical protein